MKKIKAVAFDIDGTLYPDWRFSIKVFPFIVKEIKLMYAFGKVRKELRELQKITVIEDFFKTQATLLSKHIKKSPEELEEEINQKIYEGWKPLFRKVKPFKYAVETVQQLKQNNLKIALMSDFLPEQKEDVWGIIEFCDVSLGTENTGAMKPSSIPFYILAEKLNVACDEILYVGNNIKYDIDGAKNVGMQTAYKCSKLKKIFGKKPKNADFYFSNYKELKDYILQNQNK